MYYSKIEAADVDQAAVEAPPGTGATALGLAMLVVGLPLLAARALLWAVGRYVRRAVRLGGSVGQAAIEAARTK
jgi:hypothetical protein